MDKLLIIGIGGRERALGWNLSQNDRVLEILYVPTGEKFQDILNLITDKKVNMAIVGSEEPLFGGIVDFLNFHGVRVFGPTMEMARVESDKFYSFDLMNKLGIPQAHAIKCVYLSEIEEAIERFEEPVLKCRWPKKGKGVRVYSSQQEAKNDLGDFVTKFGLETLVAKRLYGQEFSVFGIADGENLLPFKMAFQDHKPAYDGDAGPNTGGMGAYGPVPIASKQLIEKIAEEIMLPIVRRINYKGFLYAGMILTEEGPKVIEFNARFGDPEAQPAMMMLAESLYDPLKLSLEGKISEASLSFREGAACCVVLASRGYPVRDHEKGLPISGIEEAEKIEGIKVFPAGAKFEKGKWYTNGGRVLGVTSYSVQGIEEAQKLAYKAVSRISVPRGFHFRRDIANKAIPQK